MNQRSNPVCDCEKISGKDRMRFRKAGFFFRKSDQKKIQRYCCIQCNKSFSSATREVCYRQKKRNLNIPIYHKLCGGFSKRRTALVLRTNRKTIIRKFRFLAALSFDFLDQQIKEQNITEVQFDDMETFEHTKCKPISITIAVDKKTRRILGVECSQMPAKGLLSKKARLKYGYRKDERSEARTRLFKKLKTLIRKDCIFHSDKNPHYSADIKKHFKYHEHKTFKGKRGCVVGQGELKRGGFDPIFSLNHTCAMIRDNLKRMSRRTWCTTKKIQDLNNHLALYTIYHNEFLIKATKSHQIFSELTGLVD